MGSGGGLRHLIVNMIEIQIYTNAKFSLQSNVVHECRLRLFTFGIHVQKEKKKYLTLQSKPSSIVLHEKLVVHWIKHMNMCLEHGKKLL